METLKIDKTTARKLYPETPKWFQNLLINTFGEEFFSKKITDRIKTFEDAYAEADEATRAEFDKEMHDGLSLDTKAYLKRKLIAKVLRGSWEPDWNDGSQRKWYPWFEWSAGSGFGFSHSYCHCDSTATDVGSRLCFPTQELSDYFGKQFIDIHREFLTIK